MNKLVNLLFVCIVSFTFVSCSSDNDDETEPTLTQEEKILGKWVCTRNAYGEYLDDPIIIQFNEDLTGYIVFCEGNYSERIRINYWMTTTRIHITEFYEDDDPYEYELKYQFSDKDKTLTLTGMDDNDMKTLRFTRQ